LCNLQGADAVGETAALQTCVPPVLHHAADRQREQELPYLQVGVPQPVSQPAAEARLVAIKQQQ